MEKKKSYILWNKQYENLGDIAYAFGLHVSSIYAKMKKDISLEEVVTELLHKEDIHFHGKKYPGISALATAYNLDPSIVFDRLKYGFEMERALFQPIKKINRPDLEMVYRGKTYANKSELCRELGVAVGCIHEMMVNHDTDFETAVDIYWETKVRAGIPAEEMISYLPACFMNGKPYKTVTALAKELGITYSTLTSYKNRYSYEDIIDTLKAMQQERKDRFILNGEVKTYMELMKMGYTSSNYKQVPKESVPMYPQLQNFDFNDRCIDVLKIYEEVKEEKLKMNQEMKMDM